MADTMPDSESNSDWSYRNVLEMGFVNLYERTHCFMNCGDRLTSGNRRSKKMRRAGR